MKRYSYRASVCLLFFCLACSAALRASATEIVPGVFYPGGSLLVSSGIGIEFTVPQGWQAVLPRGADVMFMEPDKAVARIIISAIPGSNADSLMQLMNQTQTLDRMSQLVPAGKVKKQGKFYYQQYRLQGNNPRKFSAEGYAVLGDNQAAFIAIALEPEGQQQYNILIKNLVDTVKFTPASSAETATPETDYINWERQLRGRSLHYINTTNGVLIDRKMNLCSNHNFIFSDSDSYVSRDTNLNFSASSRSGKKGRWQIRGKQLMLQWSDGTDTSYILSRRYIEEWDEWGTFLNDDRWFNVANKACF